MTQTQHVRHAPVTPTLPAGTYWIGDPCYLPLDRMAPLWCKSTDHGDDIYHDGDGNEYSVDSGQLGIAQLLVDVAPPVATNGRALGVVVTFAEPVKCLAKGGLFRFSDVAIDTR